MDFAKKRVGSQPIVNTLGRFVWMLTAALGLAVIARSRVDARRALALQAANARLRVALAARDAAFDRERDARADAERASDLQDRFLATVSHELRTPLNAIIGWAHVMKGRSLSDDQAGRAIDGIERNATAQSKLITDLLDVSRLIRGRLAVRLDDIDFRRPIGAAVEGVRPLADAKGLALLYQPCEREVPVRGDTERVQQIAANLLSNAVKFTPRGGRVSVD